LLHMFWSAAGSSFAGTAVSIFGGLIMPALSS
jgi:hypothetical protein